MKQRIHTWENLEARSDACEMQPTDDGRGKRRVKVATIVRFGSVELSIDLERLLGYALKSMRNRTQRATIAGGAVEFRARLRSTNRVPEPSP